ncbi:prominin-1-like [Mya arenaria]|uniref:prominin-1-like n=1 Tax=Mya arenaria TaxID=6604 RepID=UPI0022E932AE|nr:prominin-1-like [Mya arenaria]
MWVAIWGWTLCLVLPVHAVDPVFTPEILSDAAGNTADSASMITWAGWPATDGYLLSEPSRISEGLSTYYSMVHGFIDAVFAKGFPDDVLELVMTQNFTSFNTDVVSTNVTFFAGFACTIVVGLLFILIFPIVACCFCCCRCCGNCGGEMRQEPNDTENVRRKACLVVTLVISSTFILVASICLFVINGDMSTVINSIDGTVDDSINDVKVFTNNTVVEAKHVIGTNFNFTIDVIFRDIDNIDVLLGIPVRDEIKTETNISFALATAGTIVTEMDDVDSALTNVENTMTELTTSINALNESLANITTSMDDIFANCPACPVAGRPDYSSATVSIDMSQFPNDDMASARSSMDDAKNTNMTDEIQKAELEVDNIPETVKNDSNQAMTDMKSDIDSIRADLDDILGSIDDVNDEVQGGSETGSFTELVGNYTELAKTYGKYRLVTGIGQVTHRTNKIGKWYNAEQVMSDTRRPVLGQESSASAALSDQRRDFCDQLQVPQPQARLENS